MIGIIILAAMIFVLSGMIGYLYWQQTRMNQQIQSLVLAITNHLNPTLPPAQLTPVDLPELETTEENEDIQETNVGEVDDRVSVEAEHEVEHEVENGVENRVEHVEGPPASAPAPAPVDEVDIDALPSKTVKQLHEILTKKGIPFGKRDAKPVLIELIRATT